MNTQGKNKPHTVPRSIIYLFFILGIFSATAFRAIIVAQNFNPSLVRPIWYIATIGYICFFIYRFYITRKRKHAIEKFSIIKKLQEGATFTEEEREVLLYLVQSIEKSPEDINYCVIFVLSIAAIIFDIFIF